jgi:hypothetical protein
MRFQVSPLAGRVASSSALIQMFLLCASAAAAKPIKIKKAIK